MFYLRIFLIYIIFSTSAIASELTIDHSCQPTDADPLKVTTWQSGLAVVQKDQPCWFRIQGTFAEGELLQFFLPGFDLELRNTAGQVIGHSSKFGESRGLLLFANQAAYPTTRGTQIFYAKIAVPADLVLYKYPDISTNNVVAFSAQNSQYETLISMQCAVLLTFGFVSLMFWLLLHRRQYLLFFLMNALNAAFIFYSSGLIHTHWQWSVTAINLIVFGSWVGNFCHGLLLLDLFRTDNKHSNAYYTLVLANIAYLATAVTFYIDLNTTYVMNAFGQSIWYLALLILAIRSFKQGNWVTVIATIGMIPAILFYWPGHVLWSLSRICRWFGQGFAWEFFSQQAVVFRQLYIDSLSMLPQGAFWDTLQQLAFPALYSCSLAYHAYLLNKVVIRTARADPLTGLANRSRLIAQTDQYLNAQHGPSSLVFAVNIDRFHKINQTLGFDVGDQVLVKVASKLASIKYAMTGRSHSDHFFQVLFDQRRKSQLQHELKQLFAQPADVDGQVIDISISVGMAPLESGNVHRSFLHAELALLHAQQQKLDYAEYLPQMQQAKIADLTILSELRLAVATGQIQMYLQPQYCSQTQHCHGAEALIRWHHPERGIISPAAFIPFAESTGHITELTRCMVRNAMRCSAQWRASGQAMTISVNLSTVDLSSDHLLNELPSMLEESGALASDLCFEITESAAMADTGSTMQRIHRLAELGFKLSIDDFGTGYSSLAYLQQMPVTEIKIDRVFVRDCHATDKAQALLRSMVDMAKALQLSIVAEGVETAAEFAFIQTLAVDTVQGFYLAKPLSEHEFSQTCFGSIIDTIKRNV